ncbi:MAG: isoprenylcysteine carboxylmethyltransferase family protein [Candidatus Desantisbacteria bacterium]
MNFTLAYIAFLIISIVYRLTRLSKSYAGESKPGKVHAGFNFAIMLFLYLSVFIGSISEYFYYCVMLHTRQINILISVFGLLMYIIVIPLRAVAATALGQQMSQDIKIIHDHKVVTNGPYAYLRHPLALCVMLEVLGLTLISNAYYSFIMTLVLFFPFMFYRVYLEEKALIEQFGSEYLEYKKRVYAFMPLKRR